MIIIAVSACLWSGLIVILLIDYCYFSIYRQICDSSPPLHPVLPALLEVFVNSALVPASNRGSPDQTVNEPISEHEIRAVFQVIKSWHGKKIGSTTAFII